MRSLIAVLALAALFVTPAEAYRWRESSPPPLRVVDANNEQVGQYTFNGCFARVVDGYLLDVCDLQVDGTVVFEDRPQLLFLQPGCQGTPYLAAFRNALSRWTSVYDGMIHFAGDPITTVTIRSFLHPEGEDYTCEGAPLYGDDWSITEVAGPLQAVPLSTLGTPPFRVR